MGADESGSEIGPWLRGSRVSRSNELLAIDDGFRESEQSWHELLVGLRDENGLTIAPELATGDGVLGFWAATRKTSAEVGIKESQERSSSDLQCRELNWRRSPSVVSLPSMA